MISCNTHLLPSTINNGLQDNMALVEIISKSSFHWQIKTTESLDDNKLHSGV